MLSAIIDEIIIGCFIFPLALGMNACNFPNAGPTPDLATQASTETPADLGTPSTIDTLEVALSLALTSPAFSSGQPIPVKFSCGGQDVSPQLNWTDPPAGTQSYALIMDDPDAPVGT